MGHSTCIPFFFLSGVTCLLELDARYSLRKLSRSTPSAHSAHIPLSLPGLRRVTRSGHCLQFWRAGFLFYPLAFCPVLGTSSFSSCLREKDKENKDQGHGPPATCHRMLLLCFVARTLSPASWERSAKCILRVICLWKKEETRDKWPPAPLPFSIKEKIVACASPPTLMRQKKEVVTGRIGSRADWSRGFIGSLSKWPRRSS